MDFNPQEMDHAAADAQNDLMINYSDDVVDKISEWWYTWYMKTGHKRLGRILVDVAKVNIKGK